MNGSVHALAAIGDDIYAGGDFTMAGGVIARRIARWDGAEWYPLGGGVSGAGTSVRALTQVGSDLYAGGIFSTAGSVATNNVAKWDGATWSALGSGTDGAVLALATFGTEVWVGGEFATAGGRLSDHIAVWNSAACGNGELDVTEECDDGNVSDGDCCSSECTIEDAGSSCVADANICTDDVCNDAGVCEHIFDGTNDPFCESATTTTVSTTTTAELTTSTTLTTTSTMQSTTTTQPANTCGDPSGDGNITTTDALMSLIAAVGIEQCSLAECDVNGDGQVTASDALLLLKVAAGEPIELTCPA